VRASGAPDQTITGTSEQIAAALHAFHAAGAEHMTCILDPWDAPGIERCGPVIEALHKLEGLI
jgi:hypothetical protein